jgi:hypothetical protein
MEAPPEGLTREGFIAVIRSYYLGHYRLVGWWPLKWICAECSARIQLATCYATIHPLEIEARYLDGEKIETFSLPYCPNCEGLPKKNITSIHVPREEAGFPEINIYA